MNIPPKYEDVVVKLDAALAREEKLRKELESALAHEDSMREEPCMARKAVQNSTLELVSLQQRLTVAERERDAALAREAEVGRLYDSLVNRSNRERDASYKREDALREELAKFKAGCVDLSSQVRELEHKMDYYKGEGMRADDLQQRLTVAEKLLQRVHQADALSHCCLLWKAIDAALKPAAECEHSFHYFGDYPRRRCNNCNALEVVAEGEGS